MWPCGFLPIHMHSTQPRSPHLFNQLHGASLLPWEWLKCGSRSCKFYFLFWFKCPVKRLQVDIVCSLTEKTAFSWLGTICEQCIVWCVTMLIALIMNTCCCWSLSPVVRGNYNVKMTSLIMNTCTFLCVLLFHGQMTFGRVRWTVPLQLTMGKKLLLFVHKSNWEKWNL
jgi:hypothetical protein